MRVIVETNFLLQLAYRQDQAVPCKRILAITRDSEHRLILPAYAIAEGAANLAERARARSVLRDQLKGELDQLARGRGNESDATAAASLAVGNSIQDLLATSLVAARAHFEDTVNEMLQHADVIPCDHAVLADAANCAARFSLAKQGDAIVLSSVMHWLRANPGKPALFIENDRKDFADQDLVDELTSLGCRIEFSFGAALKALSVGAAA